jgi:hypothetical protein
MNHVLLLRTAARWKIPRDIALQVLLRDERCIYCSRAFELAPAPRAHCPSWEHIINDVSIVNPANIALCCVGCNSSKGTKPLQKWLESSYCRERGITARSLAAVAVSVLAVLMDEREVGRST